MKIVIYNEKDDFNNLKQNIENFFMRKNVKCNIILVSKTEDLCNEIYDSDIIFLDIKLKQISSIDIGTMIHHLNHNIILTFITNYSHYKIDGYQAYMDRYLLNPLNQNQFDMELEQLIKDFSFFSGGFLYTEGNITKKIYYKDILYIEFISSPRKTQLHLENGKIISMNYPLKYWMNELKGLPFCQSYKSILVDLNYVAGFQENDIILTNNEHIPLSRGYKKTFMQENLAHQQKQ